MRAILPDNLFKLYLKMILILSLLLLFSCSMKNTKVEADLLLISLVELLAFPDRYNGKKVEVKGYLLNGYLYLSKDNAKITRDISMAIHIAEASAEAELTNNCNDSYATVVGVFRAAGSTWDAGKSTIDPVETVNLYQPGTLPCWQALLRNDSDEIFYQAL